MPRLDAESLDLVLSTLKECAARHLTPELLLALDLAHHSPVRHGDRRRMMMPALARPLSRSRRTRRRRPPRAT